jgi:beta-lactamase regulating signal transducer with metallopeptidase domain
MEAALWSFGGAVALAITILIARQFKVRLKLKDQIDEQDERLKKIEACQPLLTEGMFWLLTVAKNKGEINGDTDDLFKRYNAHLFSK